ncbi:MAG: BMC domain-containing protein [Thermotaleaceae bacterium]
MVAIRKINSPSKGILRMLSRRINDEKAKEILQKSIVNSLGLIQGQLSEIIVAGDIAEKASNVEIAEISGICPQHITMIGVFGDTGAVSEALKAVEEWQKGGQK